MAESNNLLDSFRHYFSVRRAVTDDDLRLAYQMRYRVYCEEFGYERPEHFPDQAETDEFDRISTHCLITHLDSDWTAGCIRICPASVHGVYQPLPYDKYCAASLNPEAMATVTAPPERICEASRLAVDGAFRRRPGEASTRFGKIASIDLSKCSDEERRTFPILSLVLMLAGTATSQLLERPYTFGVMEPFMPRLLKRFGMSFRRMGHDLDYHGVRAVYLTDTDDFVRDIPTELGDLYAWIHEQLREAIRSASLPGAQQAATCPASV